MVAADVVEVDVDPVRGGGAELLPHGAVLVVERGVEAVLVDEQLHLLRRAGGADHPRGALELGELPDLAADGAGGTGDEDGVALLEGGGAQQSGVGGEPGHAQHPQVRREGRGLGVDLDGVPRVHDGVLAPAEEVQDVVADGDALGVGGDDLADGAALHGLAQLVRGDVGLRGAHTAAHVRVDGEVRVPYQHLALGRGGDLRLEEGEVLGLGPADGPAHQVPLAAGGGGCGGVGHGLAPFVEVFQYLKQPWC